MVGIYKIINIINNKVYIGKSLLLQYRWKKHLWNLNKGNHVNKHLQSSFNKYGCHCFIFVILEYCNKDIICDRERYYISEYRSTDPNIGYNKTSGGDGLCATDEIKNKISNSLKGKKHTKQRRLNQSIAHLGKSRSLDHKLAIGKAREKTIIQKDLTGNILNTWKSAKEISEKLNYDGSCISRCCNNKQKTAYGYKWQFSN